MEGKIVVAAGGCAVLAGIVYIFQGGNKTKEHKTESSGSNLFVCTTSQ